MSEVKEYAMNMLPENVQMIFVERKDYDARDHAAEVYFGSWKRTEQELDAQRLRADTAEAELKREKEFHAVNVSESERMLAAAEQRIAELTDVERVTMAILGKDKDPSPGVDWHCHRMWRVNDVRELVRAALNQKSEGESHE